MTEVATPQHASRDGEAIRPPRSRALIAALALALVVGLALGRFLFFSAPAARSTAPAQVATLESTTAALERRVEADPSDVQAWQQLGGTYTNRAIASGDPAFYDLAARAFDGADAAESDAPDTLVGRGKLLLSLHQFPGALELGRQAVALRPDHAASLGVLVDAQVELGDYDAAAGTLQQMLDRSPDVASLARASYLRELHGDLAGATLALSQADGAGSAPLDRATIATLLGDLRLRQGQLDQAGRAYDEALELSADLPLALAGRARVLAASGDVDGAIALLSETAERTPVTPVVLLHADLLRLAGRADEAADADELVRASAALQEASGQVVDLELAGFEADRDPETGLRRARAAHDARPDNVFAQEALAWALHQSGDSAAAVPLMEQSLRLGGGDAGQRVRAAVVFAAVGDEDLARRQLEAAFAESPWTAVPHLGQAEALAGRLGVPLPDGWRHS